MILSLFRKTYFAQIALLFGLALFIWLPAFIKPQAIISSELNLFSNFIFSNSAFNISLYGVLLGFILLLSEALFLSYLFSIHQLTHRNSFLSGFLFVLFLSRTPEHLGFHPALLALLFVLLGLSNLLENYKSNRNYSLLLTASIWFSVASLFVPSAIVLFLIIWICIILFQSFSIRSIPISLIGLISPYFFIWAIYFWYDKSLLFFDQLKTILDSIFSQIKLPNTYESIELLFSGALLVLASTFILPRIGNQVISIRKKTSFMYWFLVISILISLFSSDSFARELVFIPFAAVLGFYFSSIKHRFWADVFISLIFVIILVRNFGMLFYA